MSKLVGPSLDELLTGDVKQPEAILAPEKAKEAGVGLPSTPATVFVGADIPKYQFCAALPFHDNDIVFVDTETTGLSRFDVAVGVGLMNQDEEGTYLPFGHSLGDCLVLADIMPYLRSVLENPKTKKVFHNAKFDIGMLAKLGIAVQGEIHDTMVQASLLDENRKTYRLKDLANEECGMPPDEKNLLDKWLVMNGYKTWQIAKGPSDLVGTYCYGDCLRTKRLYEKQRPKIVENPWLMKVDRTECDLAPILLLSEMHGVRVDTDLLEKDRDLYTEEVAALNRLLWDLTGNPMFNAMASSSLYQWFEKQDYTVHSTDKGNPRFDDEILSRYPDDAVCRNVLAIREKTKALSTYVQNLLDLTVEGRVYPTFNALRGEKGGAVTGRMSSDGPNMQNQPGPDSKRPDKPNSRKYFVPDEGTVWLGVDYSQIEYRIFAHYTGDKNLINAYKKNPWIDFHQMVADMMGIPDQRKQAKSLNFGLLYAMGQSLLAQNLGVPEHEAKRLYEIYHKKFPATKKLRAEVEHTMVTRGYVRNLFGRHRRIKGKETYKSLNSLIQGSAADLFKDAVVRVYPICHEMGVVPLLYVHDEIIFQLPEEKVEAFLKAAVPVMQDYPMLDVPVRVDCEVFRKNWAEGEPLKLDWNV